MKFKILYSLWCGIPVVAGLFHVLRDVSHPYNKLFGLDSAIGLVCLQIGLLNLLNAFYGSSKPGIRFAALGVNVLALGLIAWMIHLFTKSNYSLFLLGVMATMALFSLFNKRLVKN
ncbi:MAG: hypothetical protein JSS69_10540 [Acidobacteria bacterium]|nr:hypothetical protein [Acidobacteriota bacterium]MBS1866339.1 hypothetical protein [Acidobacteriota bacterium]